MLKEKLQNINIILASGSPRRQQFFRDLGLDFEVRLKEVDEVFPPGLKGGGITQFLSELKATPYKQNLQPNDLLVTSDTIVWHNEEMLGKPKDRNDAMNILRSLSGRVHQVFTSVTFTTKCKTETITEVTNVTFALLSDEEIDFYLDRCAPFDKAGAYGIQEWIGFIAVEKIEGSYTNVMGMPTAAVYRYLTDLKIE